MLRGNTAVMGARYERTTSKEVNVVLTVTVVFGYLCSWVQKPSKLLRQIHTLRELFVLDS